MTDCTTTSGPNFPGDENNTPSGCTPTPDGNGSCPTTNKDLTCKPWQLSKSTDSCFIDNINNEALAIAGADFNVYKLLGVHEQGQLVDVTGNGNAISGGAQIGFNAPNAFDIYNTQWKSLQRGSNHVIASSYIGYNFGEIKTNDNSRRLYGIDASVRKHITAIALKQSPNPNNRVTKARLERSDDGMKWYGVQIISIPDNDCLNVILSSSSVPSRHWRLRPVEFNGGDIDHWSVLAFQMFHNYEATDYNNIQDKILLENRDRDYDVDPITLKGSYDLVDVQSELTRMGIELPSQNIYASLSFSACVASLGRPIIIGDIVQLPSETQFSAKMEPIEKWLEVTDVAWSTEGYTPGWQPTLLRIVLQPAFVSQETQDIFGDLSEMELPAELGLVTNGDGNHPIHQDYSDVSHTAQNEALDAVPERGAESSGTIRAWESEEIDSAAAQGIPNLQKIGQNNLGFQTEDAMPPNNKPFTEGEAFPTTPTHSDYHRLTYESIDSTVPARLYRYSSSKGRWIFLERDNRALHNSGKPILQEFLKSKTTVPTNKITK